ncbi:MAG: hypothetical protein K6C94_06575, partial [Candidatus Gastranaerophilales bacterium]|nr:hypothetical protein [Candidatus Gastranaerophilales bacterium]
MPIPPYNLIKEDFSVEKAAFRQPFGLQYKKRPIVIYGCSFAYGHRLKPTESMGYVLSEKTKRPVYNYASSGTGIQHVLYFLDNTKDINNDVEYVLYLFINEHIYRMYDTCGKILCFNFMEYEQQNDKFILKKDRLKYLKNLLSYKYL